jgi:hypothetical protein
LKIAVVGTNSFFGKALVNELLQNQYEVLKWSRNKDNQPDIDYGFEIGQRFTGSTAGLDAIFILAWKQAPRNHHTFNQNVSTIGDLIANAQSNNVKVIFVSTLGAVGVSDSYHVTAKQEIESLLPPSSIIRPASISNDSGALVGDVAWIDKLRIPVEITFKPDLHIATVGMQRVIATCLDLLQPSSNTEQITLIDEVSQLHVGKNEGFRIKIRISQKFTSRLFRIVKIIPITSISDIADKWEALEATQEFLSSYSRQI